MLQQLCERLKFNPEAASALHKSLYRQKVDQILEEKKKITGDLTRCVSIYDNFNQLCLCSLGATEKYTQQRFSAGHVVQTT